MGMTEAQRKAKDKYDKENYRTLQAKIKLNEYNVIDEYCKQFDISKARFIVWACNYFISQGILPPESEILAEYTNDSGDSQNDNNGGNE